MISLLQKVLQKHHKWLFSILLVVVIVSFVFTVGSSPGIGRRSRVRSGKLFSLDLSSRSQVEDMLMEVQMSAQLNYIPIFFQQQVEHMLTMRLAKLSLAEHIGIPVPNKDQITKKAESYPVFLNEDGVFSVKKYNEFLDSIANNSHELAILEKTLTNDLLTDQVDSLMQFMPNAFLSDRATEKIVDDNTQYTLQCAQILKSNFESDINCTDQELEDYYNKNDDNYKTDLKYVVDYIKFDYENFANEIPAPSKKDLKNFYNENKHLFKNFEEGSQELKDALVKEYGKSQSIALAREKADNLSYELYQDSVYRDSVDFIERLRNYDVQLEHFDAISLKDLPSDLPISAQDFSIVEKLNDSHYFSDAISGADDNIYILIYKKVIPSKIKPFYRAKDDVRKDLYADKLSQKFKDEVAKLSEKVEKLGISSAEAFAMFAEQNDLKLTEFTNRTSSEIVSESNSSIGQIVKTLDIGKVVTDKYFNDDECWFMYMTSKDVNVDVKDDDRTQVEKQLQSEMNQRFSNDYIFKIIEREMEHFSKA